MDRRTFIGALAGGLFAAPLAAEAQQAGKVWRIGYLALWSSASAPALRLALVGGLRALGYREGENLAFENRFADGKAERLPTLADELVQRRVDVIVALSRPEGLAAKQATSLIPIVVVGRGDILGSGLVANGSRPGGNVTGLQLLRPELGIRQMELLKQVRPGVARLALLGNPDLPSEVTFFRAMERGAPPLGVTVLFVHWRTEADSHPAFTTMAERRVGGLVVAASMIQYDPLRKIVALAARHRIPTMYPGRQFVNAGGLISYSTDLSEQGHHAADYVDRILKGAKPGDLPVEQPTKLELVINLKTARALRLTIPSSLLLRADEVLQ